MSFILNQRGNNEVYEQKDKVVKIYLGYFGTALEGGSAVCSKNLENIYSL